MSNELIVEVIAFATGIIGLLAAILGRKKHITNRQEYVHRQETVHIEKKAELEFVARCHACGKGIRDGEVHRRNVKVGNTRHWKRGFMGIGGRWEEVKQYATVDLCPRCAGTRTSVILLAVLVGVILLIFLANRK